MRQRILRMSLALWLTLLALAPHAQAAPRFARIQLPQDARMHADAPNEWWYYTGHLRDSTGRTYGFELVNFKFSHIRDLVPSSPVDTLYRIDLAITDEQHKRFYSSINYLQPMTSGIALATDRLHIRMPGPDSSLSADALPGPGLAYHVQGNMAAGSVDLTLRTQRKPLLQGGNGVVPMGPGGYSYYYSLTSMDTKGTLTLNGTRLAVTGLTWMDHQWGTWSWQTIRGWDWMAVQLADGTSLAFSNFVSGHGASSMSAAISFRTGSQAVTRGASMRPLGPHWTSPVTGITYPQGWRVSVPSIGLDATVTPTVAGQEMVDQFATGAGYWEGSGRLTGTLHGKPITGLTYTELVGYGGKSAPGF